MPVINQTTEVPVATGGTPPCEDWPITWTCDVSTVSPAITALAVDSATEILFALSGRRFGVCQVTSRPCRQECYDPFPDNWLPWGGSWPQPALIGGQWFNITCGSCSRSCSCTSVSEVLLPTPVHRIIQVVIDGVVISPDAYRLDNNRLLVRVDGGIWPLCNDLSKNDGEPGTWSITAAYGEPIPQIAALAMGELACEIVRGATGGDCRLPAGVTQLARQGVTIQYPDVGELLRGGRTGLYLVDLFLSAYNPAGLTRRSRVYSVDAPPFRRAGT